MIPRRYVARHIRDRRAPSPGDTLEGLKRRWARLGDDVRDLEFSITLMPDGLEKVRSMLVACEMYLRREDLALEIDGRLARHERVS